MPARKGVRLAVAGTLVAATVLAAGPAQASMPDQPSQTWGTNGRVYAMVVAGDRVVLGGSFTAVVDPSGKSYPASNLAVMSATTGAADLSWKGSADGTVTSLAVSGGTVYVGGGFSQVDGTSRGKLAALDVATGSLLPWAPRIKGGALDVVTVAASSVYVGGSFTSVTDAAGAHSRSYVAKLDASTGRLDTTWTPTPDARVRALVPAKDGSRLFLGGDFTVVNGVQNRATAAVTTASPGSLGTFRGTATNGTSYASVNDLDTDGTNLYVGAAGGGGACTAMNATTGARVWSKKTNGNLQAVRYVNGLVYCGGHFSGTGSFDGLDRSKLAVVSATAPYATTSFAPTINSALGVWSLAVDSTRLFAGGDFTKISGVPDQRFAVWRDSSVQSVPPAPTLSGSAGDAVVHLSWKPNGDGGSTILRYQVFRRTATGGYGAAYAVVSDTTTSFDDTAVSNGAQYTYEVVAVNALGAGAASNEVTATPTSGSSGSTTATVPAAPTLSATVGAGVVHLKWTVPSDGGSPILKYVLQRDGARLVTLKGATTVSYDDTSVAAGKTYEYRVRAVNAVGGGAYSNKVTVTAS